MATEQLAFITEGYDDISDTTLLGQLLEIYDQKAIADFLNSVTPGHWCRETINRWSKGKSEPRLSAKEFKALKGLLPKEKVIPGKESFRFIDLFAGIGGIRKGFEDENGL
ncbi:MAG: hypothetical protein VX281_03970, partial [Pseudomonadota bacterium]|nr:hypothetical protein [Pseudomonadota bacterium]